MRRAPVICPHWPSGHHGDVRVSIRRGWRRRVVSVCPSCDGWWAEHGTLREHNRRAKQLRSADGEYTLDDAMKHQSYY
jgi:hypothetical protein